MKKPLHGISLTIFKMWLYSPLLILAYVDYATIRSFDKAGLIGLLVAIVGTSFIAWSVIFSNDFRQFSRATPFRILIFFGLAFAIAEAFVIVLSALQEDLRVTLGLITIPAIYAFFFTPLLVMRFEVLLPTTQGNQSTNQEPSEPPSAVI
jgi:hypothetical protein